MFFDKNGNSWIAISEFHQQAYCEVQLKYKWAGIKRITPQMTKGTEIHDEKLDEFEKETEGAEQVEVKEAIKRAIEKGERFVARELLIRSPTFRLYGMIDAVEIGPHGITITDDKPCEYPYMSAVSQILGYGIAFKDFYRPNIDIFLIIKHHNGDIIWEEVLDQDKVDEMLERINRIHELATGLREFEPTGNPKKCASCSYRDICKKRQL